MVKLAAKQTALELRNAGHSYNHIVRVVGVSKSTLAVWLAKVPYVPNTETIERIGRARAASSAAKTRLKQESIRKARQAATAELDTVTKRDLFMLGLGLFIGEGTKSDQGIRFVNANPFVMNLIIKWFIEALGFSKSHMRMRLHMYPDSNEANCVTYWSNFTGIPKEQFFKSVIDVRQNKKAKKFGKLPYGTGHLTVNSLGEKRFGVFLARKIVAWSDIVLGANELRD